MAEGRAKIENGKVKLFICTDGNDEDAVLDTHEVIAELHEATDADKKTKPPAEPSADTNTSSSQSNRLLFCHAQGCFATFANEIQLKRHIRSLHGYLIKCTECVAMKQTPAEVLTCEELIKHYDEAHNKVMKEYDLKFFGDVKNWKQGYVKCNLCDTKLGSPGFWFTNELNMGVVVS